MKNPDGSTETALREEVSELREKLTELTARLQVLEGEDEDGPDGTNVSSRRDLLKLAGALAAGAAGAIVLRPIPAAALTGGNMVLGKPNDADAVTALSATTGTAPTSLFRVLGQKPPATIPANAVTDVGATAVTVPVLLAIGPDGVFPITVTSPGPPPVTAPVYPGVAPIQGIGGPIVQTSGGVTKHVSEGVDGYAAVLTSDASAVGAGVVGQSDNGVGVVGSAATDFAALGAGYIAQTSITDSTGITRIAGPPPNGPVYNFEQARDKNGVLWLSNADGLTWRRVNSVIPMTPFRQYDSRPAGPRAPNSVTTLTIAGQNGIPSDAFGVFGNLTALGPAADGFLTMYPTGQPVPSVNTLNYSHGVTAWSNFVMVPLGGGQVSIYVSGNGSTNIIFDVQGYIY